jgi:acyl-CoA thioester hydrolase
LVPVPTRWADQDTYNHVNNAVHYFIADTVEVGIALTRAGCSSVQYEVGLFTDGEEPAAVARFVHVYVDRRTRRPVPIPPEIDRALNQLR